LSDADENRHIDRFADEIDHEGQPLRDALREAGYNVDHKRAFGINDGISNAIYTSDYRGKRESNIITELDLQIFYLATAVVIYRIDNRPVGDTITKVDNMSGITVSTSLAAAIVEFHHHVVNLMMD